MNRRPETKPHGQVRQSQAVTTFGPGSLLDLPRCSVLVGGLDHWLKRGDEIHEPRLIEKLRLLLEVAELRLFSPPPETEDPTAPRTGITVWQFPEWFITHDVEEEAGEMGKRSRLLLHRRTLVRGKYVDRDKRRKPVVPVRFVRACRRGHIGDIDWHPFVHRGVGTCRRQLWIDERGTSGDLSEVWVRCECGVERPISHAARMETKALGNCDGSRHWLGPYTKEPCGEPNRLLIRTASNSYFPQLMSVISLPLHDETLVKAVDQVWSYLEAVEGMDQLRYERRKEAVRNALKDFTDEQILAEILGRRGGPRNTAAKTVKQAEIETLMLSQEEIGDYRPDGDFFARSLPRIEWEAPWMTGIDRVVLVHRLREVVAQVGFTRFESAAPNIDGELEMNVTRASLAREIAWLPAIENRGEGIFLGLRKAEIEKWATRAAVRDRGRQLAAGFEHWRHEHQGTHRQFFGLPYILLHSLSHLLITAVSLECGYPASSIRERIYPGPDGYGILLYTASSDAEGTLGGLVEAGRRIRRHLKTALDLGKLCSNDPVCAQHAPESQHEARFLLGAACHGCLLIAETSCEQSNDFLDRALVVPTVAERRTAFFGQDRQ